MADNREARAVETLAQALYEASDPSGVPWAQRRHVIRDAWLKVARDQIRQIGFADDKPGGTSR
jgi:hypothetical protein